MTKVKIATFKSRLSHYLHLVRKGEQIVVTDRKIPIARVISYKGMEERMIIPPARESPKILRKIHIPKALEDTDSLKALKEEREDDLESWRA